MKNKRICLVLAGVLIGTMLTGCANENGLSDQSIQSESVEVTEGPTNENGKITFITDVTVEEMKEYYDTTKFEGTPRMVILQAELVTDAKDVITIGPLSSSHDGIC